MQIKEEVEKLIIRYRIALKKYEELRDNALIQANNWKNTSDIVDKMQVTNPYTDNMYIVGECESRISMIEQFLDHLKYLQLCSS